MCSITFVIFFFNDTATTEIYTYCHTLSLHDALPIYIHLIQGTPLLCILFVFFFGLSIFGLPVHAWIGATLAFSIYAGAFLGEIWRGALQSIPKTQWEAGASLGLGAAHQLRYVNIPQAVRVAVPPTVDRKSTRLNSSH